METFLVAKAWQGRVCDATGILWVEAGDAASQPTYDVQDSPHPQKSYPALNTVTASATSRLWMA